MVKQSLGNGAKKALWGVSFRTCKKKMSDNSSIITRFRRAENETLTSFSHLSYFQLFMDCVSI